jgi:hypothetical protein
MSEKRDLDHYYYCVCMCVLVPANDDPYDCDVCANTRRVPAPISELS